MRRKDREISNIEEIVEIIKKCDSCSLALFDETYPYIIPMNFGYKCDGNNIYLYFHSANSGKKLDLMKKNNKVAFEMNTSHKLILNEVACNSTMEFESVCGNGEIKILDESEKLSALTCIMNQYKENVEHKIDEKIVKEVVLIELCVNDVWGKRLKK